MNHTINNKIILERLKDMNNIKIIIGAGNINNNNEDYSRFIENKLYDVALTNDPTLVNNSQYIPVLLIDFNSVFMRGLCTFLENKCSLIQFDFSTSKFYNGLQTYNFLNLLNKDGLLIIDTHIYIKTPNNNILENTLNESESNDNNKFINIYSHNSEKINERIICNNIRHFESNKTHVSIIRGDYPVPTYTKNIEYNKQKSDINYIVVTKL